VAKSSDIRISVSTVSYVTSHGTNSNTRCRCTTIEGITTFEGHNMPTKRYIQGHNLL